MGMTAKVAVYHSPSSLGSSHQGRSSSPAADCVGAEDAVTVPGATETEEVGIVAGAGGTRTWLSVQITCRKPDQTRNWQEITRLAHTSPT